MEKRINYLEGLRGVASLIVIFNHVALSFFPAIISKNSAEMHTSNIEKIIYSSPINIIFNGSFAVYLFLLLSGYVVTISFYKKNKSINTLSEIVVKRFFRLFLPILFCNILIYFIIYFKLTFNYQTSLITQSIWWLKALWQFEPVLIDAIYQAVVGIIVTTINHTYNPVLWVIPYLFLGALLVASILALTNKLRKKTIVYLIISILFINSYFFPIIIGMVLADLIINKHLMIKSRITLFLIFILGILFGSYPIINNEELVTNTIYSFFPHLQLYNSFGFYHTIGASLLLLSLINSNLFQKILSFKIFVFLGKISYSTYLVHLIIIGSLGGYIFIEIYDAGAYSTSVFSTLIIAMPVIIFSGYIIHRFIEKPGYNLSNKIYKYLSN